MTFGDKFSGINLDCTIVDIIILANLILLVTELLIPTSHIKWSLLHARDFKEMIKIVTKTTWFEFDGRKTLPESAITLNYCIVKGHVQFPYYMQLLDK